MDSDLEWLPEGADWHEELGAARAFPVSTSSDLSEALRRYRRLANTRLDLGLTIKLDRIVQRHLMRAAAEGSENKECPTVRLALLGSSTLGHLVAGIRVAGLRHGVLIEIYEGPFGTWRQELADKSSGLYAFRPEILLLGIDARHVVEEEQSRGHGAAVSAVRQAWQMARESFGCALIQQTALPVLPPLLGSAEHLVPDSPAALVTRFNADLRDQAARAEGVHVLSLDRFAAEQGLSRWHSAGLWYRAKQEVHPAMSPLYGDHVGRIVAALLGKSAKCLVLDLDHTLWGGGIGDDGLEGIEVGQGSATGEAHLELQRYALSLRDRGVVLAVCSKNDESNALLPFEKHPGMLLRREHFACFVANWEDKATNLRRIARELNLGLDSMVFVDDNPAERGLVRRELPEVLVPEMPGDPAGYVGVLSAAGYFESLGLTAEDRNRAALYSAITPRDAQLVRDATEDKSGLESYLGSLKMQLEARPFDASGKPRIVQLINKTNQFNLTTRRVLENEIDCLRSRPDVITMQLRLSDIYGEHGMIAVAVAEPARDHSLLASVIAGRSEQPVNETTGPDSHPAIGRKDLLITHWLMSCRVLGRGIEHATFNLLAQQAVALGAERLFGLYIRTVKNDMVHDLYRRLGFEAVAGSAEEWELWALDLAQFRPERTHISVHAESLAMQPAS